MSGYSGNMCAQREHINIFVPELNHFPELRLLSDKKGYKAASCSLWRMMAEDDKLPAVPALANELSAAVCEQSLKQSKDHKDTAVGWGRSIYIVDSQGTVLEHVRYQGKDYRRALRAAVALKAKQI
ncbi:uncharacterized protein LOC108606094 [Drosophila busckii]|uniref:uncharacterized protein LOC108606094 n=1 Tax=Drosophila busckii TaxID=30019 RepID=UPI00083EDD67|nr:uncharacterized protein LOC108606094 [Drosophila busckii]